MSAQVTITCPPDITINAVDFDDSFSSYGDPAVTEGDALNLTREVTYIYNPCDSEFGTVVTLTYALIDPSTNRWDSLC